MAEPATEAQTNTPATDRLVIRIKLVTQEEPEPPPPPPRSNKGPMLVIAGVVAAVLGWFSIGSLKSDPPPPPSAPIAAIAAPPAPVTPVESAVQPQPDAPTSVVSEVIPDVPQSALDTIRGTVRVVIGVTLDKQGAVIGTKAEDRGPSRYFERLSREAAKKWTFTPVSSEQQRILQIRFNFTRDGATAETLS